MFAKLLLTFMIPALLLYTTPIPQNTQTPPPADLYIPIDPYDESNLTFDQLLSLIETADNPATISHLSPADLDKLSHLMTLLAKEGILPGQEDLENEIDADIDDLQATDQQFAFMTKHPLDSKHYTIDYSHDYELIRCGWFSKKWKKTCKFVRKHKKAIIIGAVVVVAVAVVAVAVVAASPAAIATATAGTAAGAGSLDTCTPASQKSSSSHSVEPKETTATQSKEASMTAAIDENISSFKDFMAEDIATQASTESTAWGDMSLAERAREVGAHFAHKTLDEITDLAKVVPQLCQEARDLGEKILPESLQLPTTKGAGSPVENYETLVAKGHQAIDNVFSTDQAGRFTPEAKAHDPMNNFAIGMIPLPSGIPKLFANTNNLIKAGNVIDRGGLTRAGRALAKHGGREGSIFPKPLGNPNQINAQAEEVLKRILNHPDKRISLNIDRRFGEVVDIFAPEIGGLRYNTAQELIGFLEP